MDAIRRILVASELPAERAKIAGALASRADHWEVSYVDDGAEAYRRVREEMPDLLVASATLPRIDGIVLVRTVSRAPALAGMRTLLILGQESATHVRDVLDARPSALLVRPYDDTTFLRRLELAVVMGEAAVRARVSTN